jgi:cbb3-type cytochrome oxidase subunit 3
MRLSDIMGSLELSIYPQIGLVLFLGIFACVLMKVFSRHNKTEFSRSALLPLQDDSAGDTSGRQS